MSMPRTRWEYLTVKWEASVDTATQPPAHAEQMVAVRSGKVPELLTEVEGGSTIFDQLGSEGWELVTETVVETTTFASSRGYPGVSAPISVRFRFRRPLDH